MTHVHPRTTALLAIAAGILLLLPGCLEMEQEVKMEASGKGTATMSVVIDQVKMKQMQEMMKSMMGGAPDGQGPSNPAEDMSPENAKKILAGNEKVRLVEATSTVDEETQKMTNTYKLAFDSPKDLWESGIISGSEVQLEKLENGNYKFTSKMGGDQMPQDAESAEQMKMMMMPMLEPYMSGFKMTATLEMPTAIVETNGKKVGEKKVAFVVDFAGLFEPKKLTQTVVFSGEGLDWEPFKVTMEDMQRAQEKAKSADAESAPATPTEAPKPVPVR